MQTFMHSKSDDNARVLTFLFFQEYFLATINVACNTVKVMIVLAFDVSSSLAI